MKLVLHHSCVFFSPDQTGANFCFVSRLSAQACRDTQPADPNLYGFENRGRFLSYEACTTPPRNQCQQANFGGPNNFGEGDLNQGHFGGEGGRFPGQVGGFQGNQFGGPGGRFPGQNGGFQGNQFGGFQGNQFGGFQGNQFGGPQGHRFQGNQFFANVTYSNHYQILETLKNLLKLSRKKHLFLTFFMIFVTVLRNIFLAFGRFVT